MIKRTQCLVFLVALLLCSWACNEPSSVAEITSDKLFDKLSPERTGIRFDNRVEENESFNHILQDVVFNGGGVAVIDVNNDGLQDLYFSGNMVSDRLYLNKGSMKFEDITVKSGIKNNTWSTALAVADVNNDGFMDIYVGKYMLEPAAKRQNVLYINNGDLTFSEQASKYGIADGGHSTAANFFDYNKDGLPDLYVGNQPFVKRHIKNAPADKNLDRSKYTDRLYRNNGNGSFTDVTTESGITNFNYTLSATVSDMNNDGWPDIYVACDYEEPDVFYQNNGNGTFTNVANQALRHMSTFSMGVDLADFNNDGWLDIYTADMVAADNYRLKANMSGMNPEKFWNLANAGYHYQYMFNALQLNNGNGTYSEIGQMSGVSSTDWSWTTLFADFDNDRDKDLLVTNGLVRDMKNKDYINKRTALMDSLKGVAIAAGRKPQINSMDLVGMAPSVKLNNYIYANNGDLTFDNRVEEWGLPENTWTHGAAYADLDNDGDLDLVMNNMNDLAGIYRNQTADRKIQNYLRIKLVGDHGSNHASYGARVWVYTGEEQQLQEVSPVRGYFSSSEPILHFGLGQLKAADRVVIKWLDGRQIEMNDVKANQLLTLHQNKASSANTVVEKTNTTLFEDHTLASGIDFFHKENEYDDYAKEILLPYRMSRLGPFISEADVNGDGLQDFYIGGPAGQEGGLYVQAAGGTFARSSSNPWASDAASEDLGSLFFDADGDGDLDLYVVSGGNEFSANSSKFQDRLYINNGKGAFSKASGALPSMKSSGSVASAGDIDGDGDMDLFVGGRQQPGRYGYDGRSYILKNDGKGRFSDATSSVAAEVKDLGMVTDAVWMDYDGDKDEDLIVVGEWMPITFLNNEGGKLNNETEDVGMDNTSGWWNHIAVADTDGDGDDDLIVGNLGLNCKYKASEDKPFTVFVKDFDGNGSNDVYLGYYDNNGVCYPVRGRQCSSQQMPFIKKEFKNYDAFASASIDEVLGERQKGAVEKAVQLFETVIVENLGNKNFNVKKLPYEAQISPTYGIKCRDWNGDGHLDLLLAGNFYEREVETTRSDAGTGVVLLGNGKGDFKALKAFETGILAIADARALGMVEDDKGQPLVLIGNNNNGMQVYRLAKEVK